MDNAVAGLPPSTPPSPRLIFVYALGPHDIDVTTSGGGVRRPRPHTELGAWSGKRFDGVIVSFFKSVRDAKFSAVPVKWLYGGERIRNVLVTWDQDAKARSFRRLVVGCLRPPGQSSGAAHATPKATLATFAGGWGGHDRGLSISASGRGKEYANGGCCFRDYEVVFRVLAVRGTITDGTADVRVISYRRFPTGRGRGIAVKSRVGERGKLHLKNGILRNTVTNDYFCSGPAWGATGACGA